MALCSWDLDCPALASADGDDAGPAQFALANPVVLATLFAGLGGATLARCGGVCRLWRDVLLRDKGADRAIWRPSYELEHGRGAGAGEWTGRQAK
jgi:hypothetical protein